MEFDAHPRPCRHVAACKAMFRLGHGLLACLNLGGGSVIVREQGKRNSLHAAGKQEEQT